MFSAFGVVDAAGSKDLEMLQGIFNVGDHSYFISLYLTSFLADRTIGRAFGTLCRLTVVCLSVCLSVCHLSVTFCIAAKWYVLVKNSLKE